MLGGKVEWRRTGCRKQDLVIMSACLHCAQEFTCIILLNDPSPFNRWQSHISSMNRYCCDVKQGILILLPKLLTTILYSTITSPVTLAYTGISGIQCGRNQIRKHETQMKSEQVEMLSVYQEIWPFTRGRIIYNFV